MSAAPPPHTAKKQRGRARNAAPRVTLTPWAGFTAHQSPRRQPLSVCPAARCRRAKACIAALDDLYCQRTHHSLDELRRLDAESPLRRELDAVPPVIDEADLSERMERIAALAHIRRAHDSYMLRLWKAGALDQAHGPFRARGVVLKPPLKRYVEGPAKKTKNRGGQAPDADV